nr:retrovirus-related Pol polyprotein from transposon TNT 1-94 [Tanacetum cinerariifolium]
MAFLSATTSRGNYAAIQAKIMKCYNCLGEGHMAKQCTQPKRPRSFAWFKGKLMLAEAQEAEYGSDGEHPIKRTFCIEMSRTYPRSSRTNLEPVIVDENEEPKEEEFEDEADFEEEEPQEEEEDMEVDIKEEKNEQELIFPYVEADPLNPPPPAFDSEPKDVVKVEDTIELEDETVSNTVHEVGESSTATFL